MSKIRNLTEITTGFSDTDLLHYIDISETTGDRKITIENFKVALGLGSLEKKFLQYSNQVLQTNSTTTFSDLTFQTNQNSVPGTLFTKATSSRFQVDFDGYVRVHYKVNGYTDTNDRSCAIRIAMNGSGQDQTKAQCYGKNQTERSSTAACTSIFPVSSGDYFTVQFASVEPGVTSTVPVGGGIVLVESFIVS